MNSMDSFDIPFLSLDEPGPAPARSKVNVREKLDAILRRADFPPVPAVARALAVFGSRSLKDDRVLKVIKKYVESLQAGVIVTAAEPAGVCSMAQRFARAEKIPLQVHFLQLDKYARGMHEHRSDDVIKASDVVLLIHDGDSKGTYNELLRAIHFGKPFIYERLSKLTDKDFFCEI